MVVNQALADKGYAVGDRLDLTADDAPADPTVVGIAESTTARNYPIAAGPLGALGVDAEASAHGWSAAAPSRGRRSASSTAIGATVASRAVIDDPPPASECPADGATLGSTDDATLAVVGADRGDGADRGRAARRAGVRGRAPAASSAAWP